MRVFLPPSSCARGKFTGSYHPTRVLNFDSLQKGAEKIEEFVYYIVFINTKSKKTWNLAFDGPLTWFLQKSVLAT